MTIMKNALSGSAMLLSSSIASTESVFEIISLKFQDQVAFEEQQQVMLALNPVVSEFEGFKARDYFYSEENQYWIDFIVWDNLALAKKASEAIMSNTVATDIFALIDERSMLFSHYTRINGVNINSVTTDKS